MLDKIAADIRKTLEAKSFDGSLKFDCGEDGVIVLANGTAVTQDSDTDCTLRLSKENLINLLKGKLNPMMALATGKISISGNPLVAMNLAKLLA